MGLLLDTADALRVFIMVPLDGRGDVGGCRRGRSVVQGGEGLVNVGLWIESVLGSSKLA